MNRVETLCPLEWGETLAGAPVIDRRIVGPVPAVVRRWKDIPPDIEQHALNQHYLSIHLGGAKRLHRDGEGRRMIQDTGPLSYSVVPAGAAFKWRTEGPIDFMHVYFEAGTIDRFIASEFDRDPGGVDLHDCLGQADDLVTALGDTLISELVSEDPLQQAYVDDVMQLLLFRLLRSHSNAKQPSIRGNHALPPYKLRRALEFIEARLAEPIGVADIAAAVGTSEFHFSRAFRQATGRPPYAYLNEQRILLAQRMFKGPALPLETIASLCGFASASHFSRVFRRATGVSPSTYRNRL